MSALAEQIRIARQTDRLAISGKVVSMTGMTIHARGLPLPVGALCKIPTQSKTECLAEVIGFKDGHTLLLPLTHPEGIAAGQSVEHITSGQRVGVGHDLLGRVIDGLGQPCDGKGNICLDTFYALHADPPDAMQRPRIDKPMSVGIRSINALLTPGCGQRLGFFAGTGVGKSVLLGMMAKYTAADIAVIALIGERGREVGDFIAKDLGERGLQRSVLVVSTSDQSPALRVRACYVATAVAEYFRDQGANVLLLMDSVTRMAMAARQIGLAAGEPPATKGYPPSVFAALPRLLERSGRTDKGSVTGLYTVLVEGDDLNEPIADAVRGVLDGHIWLSRRLANRGQYPAVSVLESISRVMPDVVDTKHMESAQRVRRLLSVWSEIEDLVNIGAYAAGSHAEYDLAIAMLPKIEEFLKQKMDQSVSFEQACADLTTLGEQIAKTETELASKKNITTETQRPQRRK